MKVLRAVGIMPCCILPSRNPAIAWHRNETQHLRKCQTPQMFILDLPILIVFILCLHTKRIVDRKLPGDLFCTTAVSGSSKEIVLDIFLS
jgi:hypothetical protein